MAQQIQNHNAPVLSQNGVGALDRAFRLRRMMQRLTENREIDAFLCNRWLLHVAKAIFDVAKAVIFRQLRRELDHFRRIIDRNHFACVFGQ